MANAARQKLSNCLYLNKGKATQNGKQKIKSINMVKPNLKFRSFMWFQPLNLSKLMMPVSPKMSSYWVKLGGFSTKPV